MDTDDTLRLIATFEARIAELEATIDAMEVQHEAVVEAFEDKLGKQAFQIRMLTASLNQNRLLDVEAE